MTINLAYQRFSDDQLVQKLNELGVHYLSHRESENFIPVITPVELFINLASSKNSRVRLAIIAVLLVNPSLSNDALNAVNAMDVQAKIYFEFFYSAARLLQIKYKERLTPVLAEDSLLPNLFMPLECETLTEEVETSLQKLAELHQALTGLTINWSGTYNHVALQIIKQVEHEQQWHYVNS